MNSCTIREFPKDRFYTQSSHVDKYLTSSYMHNIVKSNDDDFIEAGLGGMGYSCRSYKKIVPTTNLLEVDSKPKSFKNKHFTSCNVSNVFMDLEILEKKQFLKINLVSLESLCIFQKKIGIFMSFQFHKHVNM